MKPIDQFLLPLSKNDYKFHAVNSVKFNTTMYHQKICHIWLIRCAAYRECRDHFGVSVSIIITTTIVNTAILSASNTFRREFFQITYPVSSLQRSSPMRQSTPINSRLQLLALVFEHGTISLMIVTLYKRVRCKCRVKDRIERKAQKWQSCFIKSLSYN